MWKIKAAASLSCWCRNPTGFKSSLTLSAIKRFTAVCSFGQIYIQDTGFIPAGPSWYSPHLSWDYNWTSLRIFYGPLVSWSLRVNLLLPFYWYEYGLLKRPNVLTLLGNKVCFQKSVGWLFYILKHKRQDNFRKI